MEMTISPQGGDGCNGSNENQSRLERQLEWSRRIGIDELKRIYGASLFLRCTAYLFHLTALLAFCVWVTPILSAQNQDTVFYPEWTLLLSGLLILAQYLKRLKMPFLCCKIISIIQIGLAFAAAYFFLVLVIYFEVGSHGLTYHYYIWPHKYYPFLMFFIPLFSLETNADMLWNSRSKQTRIFLIVMSLSLGIIGLFAMRMIGPFTHTFLDMMRMKHDDIFVLIVMGTFFSVFSIIWVVLMAGIFWITAFSKIRHQLFRSDALSHKQLRAVLEQKKRDVPEEELVIQEDHKDISHKKFRQVLAWISLFVQIIAACWIIYAQNYRWILRKAAELGYAKAQYKLGIYYYYFNYTAWGTNYFDAVKWFRKAADQGNAKAQFILGVCYADGRGVQQDYAEAVKWYRKSADHDVAALKKKYCAMTILNLAEKCIMMDEYDRAIAYLDDSRLQQDQNDRVRCLRAYLKACVSLAKGENAEAEIRQFNQSFSGEISLAWDVTAFRFWLKRASLSDSARKAISELTGKIGRGIQSYFGLVEANCYREAAERGDAEAQFRLGMCYADGIGVRQDYAEAVKWYRKVADQQNTALKKEFRTATAISLAETYIILDEYDCAIACLDDPRLLQDQNAIIRYLRIYLKSCALLAKGNDAGAEVRKFNQSFPNRKKLAWNVTAFRLWLKRANLSDKARKTISELTAMIDRGIPFESNLCMNRKGIL